jgi:DNA-directed RNA polymerase subunit K/omega
MSGSSRLHDEEHYLIDRNRTNAFEFVIVAGARAKQLIRGCTPKTTAGGTEKLVKVAQREVREGKIEKIVSTAE